MPLLLLVRQVNVVMLRKLMYASLKSVGICQVQDIHIAAMLKELQGALLDHDCAKISALCAVLIVALVNCLHPDFTIMT